MGATKREFLRPVGAILPFSEAQYPEIRRRDNPHIELKLAELGWAAHPGLIRCCSMTGSRVFYTGSWRYIKTGYLLPIPATSRFFFFAAFHFIS